MDCECGSLGVKTLSVCYFRLHMACLLCLVVLAIPRLRLNSGPRALVAVDGGTGWDLHCPGRHQLVEQVFSQTIKAHTTVSIFAEESNSMLTSLSTMPIPWSLVSRQTSPLSPTMTRISSLGL